MRRLQDDHLTGLHGRTMRFIVRRHWHRVALKSVRGWFFTPHQRTHTLMLTTWLNSGTKHIALYSDTFFRKKSTTEVGIQWTRLTNSLGFFRVKSFVRKRIALFGSLRRENVGFYVLETPINVVLLLTSVFDWKNHKGLVRLCICFGKIFSLRSANMSQKIKTIKICTSFFI